MGVCVSGYPCFEFFFFFFFSLCTIEYRTGVMMKLMIYDNWLTWLTELQLRLVNLDQGSILPFLKVTSFLPSQPCVEGFLTPRTRD